MAQGHNCKLSVTTFNRRMARRDAGVSLTVLNGRIALVMGCIALWFLVAPLAASAQDIAVRLVNAKSGKPLSKIRVACPLGTERSISTDHLFPTRKQYLQSRMPKGLQSFTCRSRSPSTLASRLAD